MPTTFPQPMRFCFDDVEHLAAEGPEEFAGISRTNAADHSGAEIFFDSLCRGGRHRFQKPGAELHAMGAIVVPLAARLDELAGGDHRGMTDDGDGFTLAARLHAQNAEAVIFVMKCYTPVVPAISVVDVGDGGLLRHAELRRTRARALREDCLTVFPRAVTP